MTEPSPEPASSRLERALELFLEHAAGGATAAELLGSHPELRDVLEPMLAAEQPPAGGAGGGADEILIGDFRLVRELGRGGMGIVYTAWQRSLDRTVALKVLSPALMASPSAVARFRREAAAVARLRHPGIVEVHGFGCDQDRHWFAMGLVDGEPLTKCRERFRSPAAAVALVVQVLEALQHAHAAGLVHRDVKPANVLVRADGAAVLTDFGLAHDEALPSVTTDGSFLGTLDYASPEQVQGDRTDARTDVWSAGVVLHELLAGERPFVRGSATATMKAILTEEATDLRRSVGRDLAAIVQQALHKERARRYASVGAFLADLRAWQAGGVIAARAPGAIERVLRWTRREPWRATAALLVVLLLPIVTASLGYVWANAPRIEAAAAAERAQAREDALTTAWMLLPMSPAYLGNRDEDIRAGLAALDALGAPPVDVEVAMARAALLLRAGQRDRALSVLEPVAADPAAKLVAMQIENRAVTDFDFARAEPKSAIECFALGLFAYEQVHLHKQGRAVMQHASRWLGSAVTMAKQPRAAFLFWWMVTASRARDLPALNAALDAYEHHFPGSRGLRTAVLMCAAEVPVERGFRILADIDLSQSPSANFALAMLHDRAGRLDESVRGYRAALAADPKNYRGWYELAGALERQKKFAEAADAAQHATEVDPKNGEAWSRLGTSLLQADRPQEARPAFERATAEDPSAWRPRFNLGLMQRDARELEVALESFVTAATLAPQQPEPHVFRARVLRALDRPQEAVIADLQALHLAPKDWRQWFAVGVQLGELKLHDAALIYATRATEIAPDQPTAWSRLAEVLLDTPGGDVVRALDVARRAEQLAKGADSRGIWILARAEAANGDVPAAVARLEALLAGPKEVPAVVRELAGAELTKLRPK